MRINDLTADQRLELKQCIVTMRNDKKGKRTSYEELAHAAKLVSDGELEAFYKDMRFSLDDFSCGMADDREGVLDELKEWAERELLLARYAGPTGTSRRPTLEAKLGIDWARETLLAHIKAIGL